MPQAALLDAQLDREYEVKQDEIVSMPQAALLDAQQSTR